VREETTRAPGGSEKSSISTRFMGASYTGPATRGSIHSRRGRLGHVMAVITRVEPGGSPFDELRASGLPLPPFTPARGEPVEPRASGLRSTERRHQSASEGGGSLSLSLEGAELLGGGSEIGRGSIGRGGFGARTRSTELFMVADQFFFMSSRRKPKMSGGGLVGGYGGVLLRWGFGCELSCWGSFGRGLVGAEPGWWAGAAWGPGCSSPLDGGIVDGSGA
jgi:hypothetical protein